jgi:3-oxoacyl-[acyl-carrier protein] reductase
MTKKLKEEQKEALIEAIPLARMGTAVELANAVKFLISDEASYITGENINVNGGLYM